MIPIVYALFMSPFISLHILCPSYLYVSSNCTSVRLGRARLKRDGTRAETRFGLSAKRTSSFKLAGRGVQSTTGSRGVRISGSNAGYTMFRGSVKSTGYPLHLNRREGGGRQFSRLLAAEVCASAVVMLDTPCSEVV